MARILAVDDQDINLEILTELLEDHTVFVAHDGIEAVAIAAELQPEIVLLDVMMPLISGLKTCRRLRALPETHHARIIIVSARALESERQAGLAAGADDYLTKPFDEESLRTMVHKYAASGLSECAGN